MKPLKLAMIFFTASMIAVVTVINLNMVKPEPVSETTLNMLDVMTRAFDESEGGEGGIPACVTPYYLPNYKQDKPEGKCFDENLVQCGISRSCAPWNWGYSTCQAYVCNYGSGGGPD